MKIPIAAVDGFIEDVWSVVAHVVRNPNNDYIPPTSPSRTLGPILDCMMRREFPPLPALATLVGWVLFASEWNRTTRKTPLTPHEIAVRDAARRLYDAIYYEQDHRRETND
jgi:hypothetical protein